MADEDSLGKIVEFLTILNKKIDDIDVRLRHVEESQLSQQAQWRITNNIKTMTQAQQLTAEYESSSIQSELFKALSPAHIDILKIMVTSGALSVYEIKDKLNISRTYVHTLLEQLEKYGLVRRIPNLQKLSFFDNDPQENQKEVTPRHLFSINSLNLPSELINMVPELSPVNTSHQI